MARHLQVRRPEEIPEGLAKEVQEYLATHTHAGFRTPFEIGGFEYSHSYRLDRKAFWVVPIGIDYKDISQKDPEFDKGLAEIGKKHGVRLTLPPWAYEK